MCPVLATCPAQLILLDFIRLVIFTEEKTLQIIRIYF
jgi:hypothetical protein